MSAEAVGCCAQLVKERAAWAKTKLAHTELWDAAREFIEAQRSDSVPTRVSARERLLAALEATR